LTPPRSDGGAAPALASSGSSSSSPSKVDHVSVLEECVAVLERRSSTIYQ
jgi:hypothetical protein